MELILQGWLGLDSDSDSNIGISQERIKEKHSYLYSSIATEIMDYFKYT